MIRSWWITTRGFIVFINGVMNEKGFMYVIAKNSFIFVVKSSCFPCSHFGDPVLF